MLSNHSIMLLPRTMHWAKALRLVTVISAILKNVDDNRLSNIVEYELIPMLKEYWFDEPTKVKDWSNILRSAIK